MKTGYILLGLAGIVSALGIGWFFDSQKVISRQNLLKVPDNIDYYLAGVNYHAYNDQGLTRFQLRSPYLEHFIREDTSALTRPMIDYYTDSGQWQLSAKTGRLQHKTEIFQLQQEASVRSLNSTDPFVINSELMVFKSETERLEIPQALQIDSEQLKLNAASAVLDLKNNLHEFVRVKATYEDRIKHEPG